VGNVTAIFPYTSTYGGIPTPCASHPTRPPLPPYPFYVGGGDSWNVMGEMVILNQARSLAALSFSRRRLR